MTLIGRAEVIRGEEALALNRAVHLRYVGEHELDAGPVHDSLSTDDAAIRLIPERAFAWDFRRIEQERKALRRQAGNPRL